MKDFLKTAQGKVIVGMGVVIVLLAIIAIGLRLTQSSDKKEDGRLSEPSEQKAKEDVKSPYNLYQGHWYSDREDRAEIVLEKDGTYTGTGWLNSGKYEFVDNDSAIEFKDSLDGIKTLILKTAGGETVLYDEKYQHTFYSSKEQLEKSIADKEKEDKANESLFEQKWKDVLTKAEWKEEDNQPVTVNFTDKGYEITFKNETKKESYEIEGTKILSDNLVEYDISIGNSRSHLSIEEENGIYRLNAPFLPWYRVYTADVEKVPLTQQGTTKSEGTIESETITESTDDLGNKTIIKERVIEEKDGWE